MEVKVCLAVILTLGSLVFGFNVDVDHVVTVRGGDNTLFGYSAVLLNNDDGSWLIAGAPKANFTNRDDIRTPGDIFKCKLNFSRTAQEACIPLTLRTDGNDMYGAENNQLLGASISFGNEEIVTCAPLWKNTNPSNDWEKVYPIGRCFNIGSDLHTNTSNTFSKNGFPVVSGKEKFQYGARSGFSIAKKRLTGLGPSDTTTILMGTPSLFDNKGGFIRYSPNNKEDFFKSYSHINISSDIKDSITAGSLIGYSVATGKLSSHHGCQTVVAVGAPGFSTTEGKNGAVLVFCINQGNTMQLKKQFFGKKNGGGFGTSIVFDDINDDGIDDLIIGAPTQYTRDVIDTGAVYIFYGDAKVDVFIESQKVLTGSNTESSRFGTSIECVGDMNKDNFKDIVVGAPYENELRGSIYIYHGGPSDVSLVQQIKAADVDNGLRSFGWYITAPYDIDNNNYPDFAVGSYMSNAVSVFRSRPIVNLICELSVYPSMIPLNSSELPCRDEHDHPCAIVQVCFRYTGVGIPDTILASYSVNADTLRTKAIPQKQSRVSIFVNGTNHQAIYIENNVEINKRDQTCISFDVVVLDISRQFLSALDQPLKFEAQYGLSDTSKPGQLKPMLDNRPTIQQASARFISGCNETCHPDLRLNIGYEPSAIIFADTSELIIKLSLSNSHDPAHGVRMSIYHSDNTVYLGFYQPPGEDSELGECIEDYDQNNKSIIHCDLQRLITHQHGRFNLRFNVSENMLTDEIDDVFHMRRNVDFDIDAQSASRDKDMSDNRVKLAVPIKFQSKLQITGLSTPEQQRVSNDQNIEFKHTYEIYNEGPSPLDSAIIKVCIPIVGGDTQNSSNVVQITVNGQQLNESSVFRKDHPLPTSLRLTLTTNTSENISDLSLVPNTDGLSTERNINTVFKYISCESTPTNTQEFGISVSHLAAGLQTIIEFNIAFLKPVFDFSEVVAIQYKSTGRIRMIDDDRNTVLSTNEAYQVTTEIFPEVLNVGSEKISVWIIIGSCIFGVALLIGVFIGLMKCGFFKREKQQEIIKWKRQTGYYAKRTSQFLEHQPRLSLVTNNHTQW